MDAKIKKLIDLYEVLLHGDEVNIGLFDSYDIYPPVWNTELEEINRLKAEIFANKERIMNKLEEIKAICDGIEYGKGVPKEAEELAKENNIVIIVGGSDDLMYCYGAKSYLTDYLEHSYGWDGDTLKDIGDKQLEKEAEQLGLMIWWCGEIVDAGLKIEEYNTEKSGTFSYSVKDGIEALDFKVMEGDNNVYCTGKIIKLPDDFKNALL